MAVIVQGVLNEVVYNTAAKKVLETRTDFLNDIPDQSSKITTPKLSDPIIVLADVTSMPQTLVDNVGTIPDADLSFDGTTIKMKRLDTENTLITDEEAATTSMDVAKQVIENHMISISEKHKALSVFALAPMQNSTATPVIPTTGATNNNRGFKKFVEADLHNMYERLMTTNTPEDGLIAVLSLNHINELCESSNGVGGFNQLWNTRQPNKPVYYAGFSIYSFATQNVLNYASNGTKNAFGTALGSAQRKASVFFNKYECAKFELPQKIYTKQSQNDPSNRATTIGVRKYALILPVNNRCYGAIYEG
jgi:hypothetical protein